ncbi:Fas apoptotic inhibitory molecule 2 [Cichlidogyrus casuarinus]|uniref:Fas apoptotic inhibitory molecule 2 n=1 Tax=Cichlidogyrus casuarinus TaxID=1844966 RepID=A0ABD2PW11_9PLAT
MAPNDFSPTIDGFFTSLCKFKFNLIVSSLSGVYFVSYFALVCCQSVRRGFPMNFVCLGLFTASFSVMVGAMTAFMEPYAVLIAVGITVLIVMTITFLAACTPIDFTKCYFLLAVAGIVFFFFGIAIMIVMFVAPQHFKVLHLVYCAIGVLLFSLYLAFDTQRILGGKHIELSEEDYVDGALQLYVDIMQIFIYVLQLVQAAREN